MPSIITDAFQSWNADKIIANQPAVADRMVFARIKNQDINAEISPSEGMPNASDIVYSTDITRIAKLDDNTVVYSVVLDTTVGDWEYNWIGLVDSATSTVLMIVHTDTQKKIKTVNGQQGNSLIRNLTMTFSGAAAATQITVTPETWQIDLADKINTLEINIDEKLSHKVDKADVTQEYGTSKEKVPSQALLTESLADMTNDVMNKVDKDQVTQELGQATDKVPSQKLLTDSLSSSEQNLINTIYPVGVVMWFAQSKNPNNLIPNTEWKYIGENKTVRLANQTGSNVLSTGGADSVTLTEQHLPAHKHSISANTDSFDYGNKNTNSTGEHAHEFDGYYTDDTIENASNGSKRSWRRETQTTASAGNHTHTVAIGAHKHTLNADTAATGGGGTLTITNAYIMLMGWYRTK